MTEDEVRRITHQAVNETLTRLGIDVDDPAQTQRDFAFVRSWRESTETVKKQSLIVAVTVIISGVLGIIWIAIRGHS